MKTENQMKALDLAKKVFEHFTSDALPLARQIIAMENEIADPLKENDLNKEQQSGESAIDFPTSDITPSDLEVTQEHQQEQQPFDRQRIISSEVDNLPF